MARLLKIIRVFHGLDLQEAEDRLEISQYTIKKYESGEKQIPLHVAATYSWKFGYGLDLLHFFRDTNETWIDRLRLKITKVLLKIAEYIGGLNANTD